MTTWRGMYNLAATGYTGSHAPSGPAGAAHERLASLPTRRHYRLEINYAAIAAARSEAAARTNAESGYKQRGPAKRIKGVVR